MDADIFCKIIAGELAGDIVYRDDTVVALRDIHPQAPVHILVMPIVHTAGIADIAEGDDAVLGHLMRIAHQVAKQEGLASGYRLIINEGEDGGKVVPHLHVHVLGGKKLGPKIVGS